MFNLGSSYAGLIAQEDVRSPEFLASLSEVDKGKVAVERRIMETTRSVIGRAISPHDFRRSGAFTARYWAGSEPHLASGLLQH